MAVVRKNGSECPSPSESRPISSRDCLDRGVVRASLSTASRDEINTNYFLIILEPGRSSTLTDPDNLPVCCEILA